jgi:hypothetical protein
VYAHENGWISWVKLPTWDTVRADVDDEESYSNLWSKLLLISYTFSTMCPARHI